MNLRMRCTRPHVCKTGWHFTFTPAGRRCAQASEAEPVVGEYESSRTRAEAAAWSQMHRNANNTTL